jgi:hypothetical protein
MMEATAGDRSKASEGGIGAGDSGSDHDLDRLSFNATIHCMSGCLLGEVSGLAIATALGWGAIATIALAVALAYLFGFALTSIPLAKAGLAFGAIVPIALATDTVSITIMEVIDNVFVALIPGALDAGLLDWLMWTTMFGGFAIAFPFAFFANRELLKRGKGHAHVHQYH